MTPARPARPALARLVGPAYAAVLRGPFLLLWIGQTVSAFGDRVTAAALPALVLLLGGGAADLARLASIYSLAQLVLLLVGGVLVDRLPRRAVMLATDAVRAALFALIAVLLWRGGLSIGLLGAIYVLLGASSALFLPASAGIVPQVVPPERLVPANALRNVSLQLSGVIGPALGGALVALGGAALAFGLNALTFVLSAIGLALMRVAPTARRETARGLRGAARDLAEGFRIVAASPWLWLTILLFAVVNVFAAGVNSVVLPLLARERFGGVAALGLLYSAVAVGAVLAALVLGRLGRVRRRGVVAYVAVAVQGLAFVGVALAPALPLALAASFVGGAGLTVFGVLWETTLQELVPEEALGRVFSIDMLGSFALLPVGFLAVGALVERVGAAPAVLLSGAAVLVLALGGLFARAVRGLD